MLREVWLNIGVEKIDTCKSVIVKVLLESGTMEMFMNRRTVVRYRFKLQKLERLIPVRNVNRTNNSRGSITHQVKVNVYYKGHIERIRMDICNLEKTKVILGILWLQAHNPEINWETGKVKMTGYLLLCGRTGQEKKRRKESQKEKKGSNPRERENC